ncbi:MAG: hypothetical protein LBQ22_01840 [Bacteroidales bacterium]|jgi:hypothetical protein|nr:hypothetical protein [Bacteroidales bacterium]
MSVFKRTRDPYYNELLTDDNTVYCCSIMGSDSNTGTREAPVKTIGKALITNKKYVCINDGVYETFGGYPQVFHHCIFPDKNYFEIKGGYYTYDYYIFNLHVNNVIGTTQNNIFSGFRNCRISEFNVINRNNKQLSIYNYVDNFISTYVNSTYIKNFTIKNFKNYITNTDNILLDHIFINEIDLYRYKSQTIDIFPTFNNCLFRKSLKWSWNGNIIPVSYSEDKKKWIDDLKSSLQDYAEKNLQEDDCKYLANIANKSFPENNVIHDDIEDTPIFNKYDKENNPVDLTLYLDDNNPALYMSSTGSFTGAYFPNVDIKMGNIINLNPDGTYNYENTGDLLIYNESEGNYTVNRLSQQTWNCVRSGVIKPNSRNFDFSGIQCIFNTGINTKHYFGKKQQYNNSNIPVETIEVIPYDDENKVSEFPKFSCSLSGDTQIWFHKNGNPVLFNDLEKIGINSTVDLNTYGNYAVTTADYNSVHLENNTDYIAKKINIRYFQLELNLHFTE